MEPLVQKFHNLPGTTVSEHNRSFNAFKRELHQAGERTASAFLENLRPLNRQETIHHAQLLASFEKHQQLFNMLVSSDRFLARLILRLIDLSAVFRNGSPVEIFSLLSDSLQMKIVGRLSWDKYGADECFGEISDLYGVRIAAGILVYCSFNVINDNIIKTKVTFTQKQLFILCKKHPKLLAVYFKHRPNQKFEKCALLYNYLIDNDITTLIELFQYGTPKMTKRQFAKILPLYKTELLSNAQKYETVIHFDVLYKHTTLEEYSRCVSLLFPDSGFVWFSLEKYLKFMPKNRRGDFLFMAYKEKYNTELDDYKSIPPKIVKLLELKDRLKFKNVEIHSSADAISAIKAKINVSDRESRYDHVLELINVCTINDDLKSALECLKYFYNRHKNDDTRVREVFLVELLNNFPMEDADAEHWQYLEELVKRFDLHDDYFHGKFSFTQKALTRLIRQKADLKATLKDFVKEVYCWPYYLPKKYEYLCLQYLGDIVSEHFMNDDNIVIQYFNGLHNWNSKKINNDKRLSITKHPELLKRLIGLYSNENLLYSIQFKPKDLLKNLDVDLDKDLITTILKLKILKGDWVYLWSWLNKKKPELFGEYIDTFLKSETFDNTLIYELSKAQYTPLWNKLVAKIKSDTNLAAGVRIFTFDGDFLKYAQKFIKYERGSDSVLQKTILASLKYNRNIETLKIFISYLASVYKKYTLAPLTSYLSFMGKNESKTIIQTFIENQVYKESIYLSVIISTQLQRKELCQYVWGNNLLKRYILKHTNKHQLWDVFTEFLNSLQPHETCYLTAVSDLKGIPKDTFLHIFMIMWNSGEENNKTRLVQYLTPENIDFTQHKDFLSNILIDAANKKNTDDSEKIVDFAYSYLQCHNMQDVQEKIERNQFYELYMRFCYKALIESKTLKPLQQTKPEISFSIDLTNRYITHKLDGFSKFVVEQQKKFISTYGMVHICYYRPVVSHFIALLADILGGDDILVSILEGILDVSEEREVKALVVNLLPKKLSKNTYSKKFNGIIERIRKCGDVTLDALVSNYIIELKMI